MRQRVIILAGPDRSGKTTIGKLLAKKLEIPYFKYSRDKEALTGSDMTSQMLRVTDPYFIEFLKQTGYSVIIDRHYCCEYAYSAVLGRETDQEGIRQTDRLFSQVPGIMILRIERKSYEGVQDDDPRLNAETLKRISEVYDEFFEWTACPGMTFKFDYFDPERMVEEVLKSL